VFAVFRFLDLRFIFQIVLSLFAILLGYDAISGEKERGTLRAVLANAIPRSTFIIGKLIGSFVGLSVSLVAAIAIGCLLLPLIGVPLSGSDWSRLGLIILSGLLYFGAFLTLAVFVSAVTRRTTDSFLMLLAIWIVSVMIVPRASVLMAGRAVNVPSVDEIAAEKATYSSSLWADFRKSLAGYKAPETQDMEAIMDSFNSYMDSLTKIRDDQMDVYAAKLNEERHNRQIVQRAVAFNIARLSPATSLAVACTELADTSPKLKDRYYTNAMEYQKAYGNFMKEKTGMNVGGRMIVFKIGDDEDEKPIDPSELPEFVYQEPTMASAVRAAAPDMGLLALFNLIFFFGAFTSFNRYDAR